MADSGSTSNPDEPGQKHAEDSVESSEAELSEGTIETDADAGTPAPFDPDSWFETHPGGAPLSRDFVDRDLTRLSVKPSVLQLLLVLVVMGFAGFVAWTLRNDVAYFFADDEPLDLGAVEDLPAELAEHPNALESLRSNTYVHVRGIPQRRAVAGDRQWAQLVGAAIFVESEREDAAADPIMRDIRIRIAPNEEPLRRLYMDVDGRLLRFSDLGRSHRGLIDFYRDGYNLWFCGEPLTRRQQDFRQLTIQELRDELDRDPTEAEIDRAFHCENGFLVQAGYRPGELLWQVVAVIFIALIELGGLWYVIQWLRRLRASTKS